MKQMKFAFFAFVALLMLVLSNDTFYAATEVEDNGTRDVATVIELNEIYTGQITSSSDVDWYVCRTTEEGVMQLIFAPIGRNPEYHIKVYDENYEQLTYYQTSKEHKEYLLAYKPGTFYVRVSGPVLMASDYAICMSFEQSDYWEAENNNTNANAKKINFNEVYKGIIRNASDADWFTFTTTQDGYFRVSLGPDKSADMNYCVYGWNIDIYNGKFEQVGKFTNLLKTYTTIQIPYTKGDFYIKITSNKTSDTDNFLRGKCYNLSVAHTPTKVWEKENNNTVGNATKLSLNKYYTGYLSGINDVDYYKFELKGKGMVKLDFRMDKSANYDLVKGGWKVTLTKEGDEKPIWKCTDITSEQTYESVLGKGVYYLKIESASSFSYFSSDKSPKNCLYNAKVAFAVTPSKPANVKVSCTKKNVKVTWDKASNATGYYVMRSTSLKGKYTKVATVKDATSYVDKAVDSKKKYYYKVISFNSKNGVTAKSAASDVQDVSVK